MGIINVLSKQVAELIAAGEVIERPGSVIKELVENSIDAGASSIIVEIQHGGVTLMRVTDNGTGIQREDVRHAFLRHATSKISRQDDLDSIATLGFRGEALASICAVSKVSVLTKHKDESDGTSYIMEGGEEKSLEPVGCPQGTTFVVKDLFYNVPARMKFLKKDVTESNYIANLMDRIALSHPEISFTFIRDGKQVMKTAGNGKLDTTIYQVFGREFSAGLIPASYQFQGVRMSGYVSKPVSANRASRNMQMFFVNGRYVKTKTAAAALEQAYSGCILSGKFPACVLNLELNCSELDVNVHPAKLEIRFTNEKPIYDCVYHGVRSAITSYDTRRQETIPPAVVPTKPELLAKPSDSGVQMPLQEEEPALFIPPVSHFVPVQESPKAEEPLSIPTVDLSEHIRESEHFQITPQEEIDFLSQVTEPKPKKEIPFRYIGEAFRAYIILEYGDDRIMLIDKHAAHERLLYEQLKEKNPAAAPQMLLEPVTVTLDKEEYRVVMDNKELLLKAGFDVDSFGSGTVLIRSAPLLLEKLDITEAFLEIAGYLQTHRKIILSEKMEWIYQNTACRAAVKAGNVNKPEELMQLAMMLEENPDVKYCPHGRPVYFLMSKQDIEKNFKRI